MIYSVQKAMKILSVISDVQKRPVSLMEISEKTGYPKPTCSHILKTLCSDGYVTRVSHTDGYLLGPSLYCLTRYGCYEEDLVALCRPIMRWMEKRSHATVILSVIQGKQKFIIDYADAEQNLLTEHPKIRTDDIYRTATGRAILAHMEYESIKEIYDLYGMPSPEHWEEVTSFEALLHELKALQNEKIVFTGIKNGIVTQKSIAFASPLFRHKKCIGAIGLAWKTETENQPLPLDLEEKLCQTLLRGAKEIHRRLAYEEPHT